MPPDLPSPVKTSDPDTYAIVGAAMAVHGALGCGFLEKVYARALTVEFTSRGIPFTREARFSIEYQGKPLGLTFCPDFVCFDTVIVETKAIKMLTAVDLAQTLNYLKASRHKRALLLNFGATSLEYRRFVM
jgi:GxxExxY protein